MTRHVVQRRQLDYWDRLRQTLLERAEKEEIFVGTGYGPMFEEAMAALKDDELESVYIARAHYARITDKGRRRLAEMKRRG